MLNIVEEDTLYKTIKTLKKNDNNNILKIVDVNISHNEYLLLLYNKFRIDCNTNLIRKYEYSINATHKNQFIIMEEYGTEITYDLD